MGTREDVGGVQRTRRVGVEQWAGLMRLLSVSSGASVDGLKSGRSDVDAMRKLTANHAAWPLSAIASGRRSSSDTVPTSSVSVLVFDAMIGASGDPSLCVLGVSRYALKPPPERQQDFPLLEAPRAAASRWCL